MKKKISFFSKNSTVCPVCNEAFYKEEIMTGGGRLIAGSLGEDLRRSYEPSKKYGEVFPLIYYMFTCPFCLYTATPQDFPNLDPKVFKIMKDETDNRKMALGEIFQDLDFTQPRGLEEGAASYLLGMMCYELQPKSAAPSFKQALCALRGAWTFGDLHAKYPGENYDYLEKILFHKAAYLYMRVIDLETTGEESVASLGNHGPDLDKNYGYDGILYMAGYLEYKYGNHSREDLRRKSLSNARMAISRIVGMGKSSKSKPSILLDKARDLHKDLGEEIKD